MRPIRHTKIIQKNMPGMGKEQQMQRPWGRKRFVCSRVWDTGGKEKEN
jgi:hypothetical protein